MSVFRPWRRAGGPPEEGAPIGETAEELRDTVPGERGFATVNRPPSLQSRLSNILAAGLMSTLAIGFLGWYYVHAVASRKAAATTSQGAPKDRAQGEMTLPPLGRIDPPKPPAAAPQAIERALGPAETGHRTASTRRGSGSLQRLRRASTAGQDSRAARLGTTARRPRVRSSQRTGRIAGHIAADEHSGRRTARHAGIRATDGDWQSQ
jgi:hypothetical protein